MYNKIVRFEEGAVAQVLSPHGDEFNRTIIPSAKLKNGMKPHFGINPFSKTEF